MDTHTPKTRTQRENTERGRERTEREREREHTHTHTHTMLAGIRYLLVTQKGQLVGILKKKDILEHIELFRKGLNDRRNDSL